MDSAEKLKRALSDDWEFVGDPHGLCKLLREEVLRLRKSLELIADAPIGLGAAGGHATARAALRGE